MQMGHLSRIAGEIISAGTAYTQADLEAALATLYEPIGLAAMVLHRYPIAPVIQDYQVTIRESVTAHFMGLDHVAVGGLVPVIEGAGRTICAQRNLAPRSVTQVLTMLADDCKNESITKNVGLPDEISSMMDSFADFARHSFFAPSTSYPFTDGTNRHGIAHGAFADANYGAPINFYKTIAAVDFLTFITSFRANISWLGPDSSDASLKLAVWYQTLSNFKKLMPVFYDAP
jgi:hypothetical protein